MIRLTLAASLIACGRPARLVEPAPQPTPYCFLLTADHEGRVEEALACTQTADLCDFARAKAVFFAPIAKFETVGFCHVEARR